jgi:hypothetical protein
MLAAAASLPGSLAGQAASGADADGFGPAAVLLTNALVDGSAGAPDALPTSSGERPGRFAADARARLFAPSPDLVSALTPFASLEGSSVFMISPQQRTNFGGDVALMAVGGTALVVGLMIGGDSGMLIASTGGVLGLIGLYRYIK